MIFSWRLHKGGEDTLWRIFLEYLIYIKVWQNKGNCKKHFKKSLLLPGGRFQCSGGRRGGGGKWRRLKNFFIAFSHRIFPGKRKRDGNALTEVSHFFHEWFLLRVAKKWPFLQHKTFFSQFFQKIVLKHVLVGFWILGHFRWVLPTWHTLSKRREDFFPKQSQWVRPRYWVATISIDLFHIGISQKYETYRQKELFQDPLCSLSRSFVYPSWQLSRHSHRRGGG